MSDERQSINPSNPWVHQPLPYIVRVRVAATEDTRPELHVIKVMAYSIIEAMFQAGIHVGGTGVADPKVCVERIEPDLEALAAHFLAAAAASAR